MNKGIVKFYTLFGIAFGICFPILATIIEVVFGGASFFQALLGQTNRLMLIIDMAPFVLGFVFYLVGLKQEKISELRLYETKSDLKKSQSLLEAAEKVGQYGSWEFDIRSGQKTWSKGLFNIFQLDPAEGIPDVAELLNYVFTLSDRQVVEQVAEDVFQNGKREFSVQCHLRLKNGSLRVARGQGRIVADKNNVPLKIVGTIQDVTELVLAQREAQFYKEAIDQSAIVAITDGAGVITHVNSNFCLISGYKKEELIGQTHSLLNSGVMGATFFKNMWRDISSGKIWRGEVCNRTKNGQLYWVDSSIVPFIGASGRPERYVSIRSDVTKRKVAEELVLQAHQRLEVAEDLGRIGSWECDEHRQNFRCSRGMCSLLEIDARVTLSYNGFSEFIEPSDRDILEPAIEQAIMTMQSFSCSFRVNLKNGSQKWLHADGKPVCSSDLKFEKLLVSVRDVTEKIQTELQLIDATAMAERASKTKAQFLANMSHEIRTPMNGIIGMTNLLLGSVKDKEQVDKLKIIQNCGNNLLDIINDILDFSKLEADKLELENEPFALHDSIQEIVELLNTRASEKGLVLSYVPGSGVPSWINGDITRFRQVVTNLVSNAIKFTSAGSVTIFSEARGATDEIYNLEFSVKDTGVGISEEVKTKLFQSFSQVDASTTRRFGGTGLGLAITKGICERMGGKVWVESEAGKGSTFTFTLNAKAALAIQPNQDPSPFVAADVEMGKKKPLNILVVEDNRVNQLVLVGLLGKLGYCADIAGNGLEALHSLELKFYDLILMDCHMPVMDGFAAAEKIISQYLGRQRPRIVAVTASTLREDVDRCLKSGMDDFMSKPITLPALRKVLGECKLDQPLIVEKKVV